MKQKYEVPKIGKSIIRTFYPNHTTTKEYKQELLIKTHQLRELRRDFEEYRKTRILNNKETRSYLRGEINPFDVPKTEKSIIRMFDSLHRTRKEYQEALEQKINELNTTMMYFDSYHKKHAKKLSQENIEAIIELKKQM